MKSGKKMIDRVVDRTESWGKHYFPEKGKSSKEQPLSDKAKKLQKLLFANQSLDEESVNTLAKMFSVVIGEDIPTGGKMPDECVILEDGVMVTLISDNVEGYKKGETVLIADLHGIKMDGITCDYVLSDDKSDIRPATEKEIREFFGF